MICACVDIGTNTTRVLVAEVEGERLETVLQQRAFTSIGLEPEIPRAKIAEVSRVVAEQIEMARAAGAGGVRVVATAAIRSCANREEFVAAVPGPVEILGGEEEARLAFLGATRTFGSELPGAVAVVDVGGGSTEIAVGSVAGGVRWSSSYPVGSAVLADRYLQSDPPSSLELDAAGEHARQVLGAREIPPVDCAIAVGGSAASLPRLIGSELEPRSLVRAMGVLTRHSCAAVAETYALDPLRVRLLPAGLLILDKASGQLGQPLQIGHGGLREGVLLDMARSL